MQVLIVQSNPDLGRLWGRYLERQGHQVSLATSQADAVASLQIAQPSILILDLDLVDGSAIAVADYVNFRLPMTKIIFVTATSFFSDGSVFQISGNVCAFMPSTAQPDDLAALVDYYGVEGPNQASIN